jgi:hypothetical protein
MGSALLSAAQAAACGLTRPCSQKTRVISNKAMLFGIHMVGKAENKLNIESVLALR